jgi:hypothetical protein
MSGAIPPIHQYAFMAWCLFKAQGHLYLYFTVSVSEKKVLKKIIRIKKRRRNKNNTRVCPKVSGLAAWSENCKWYSSLPLDAVVSLFYKSV